MVSRSSTWQRFSFHCHKWESHKMCTIWHSYRWNFDKELGIIMHGLIFPKNRMQWLPGMGTWRMSCGIWWFFADVWFYFWFFFLIVAGFIWGLLVCLYVVFVWVWVFYDFVLVSWAFFLQDKGLFKGLCCHFSLHAPLHLGEGTNNFTHQLWRLTSSGLCSS